MNDRRITITLLAVGALLLIGGGFWLLLSEHAGKGVAALAAGIGFALICFSQAVRMLTKQR
jgi:hypothetical protein